MVQFPLFGALDNQKSNTSGITSEAVIQGVNQPLTSSGALKTSLTHLSGPAKMAQAYNTSYLGSIPMDSALLSCGERGEGLLEAFPSSLAAVSLSRIVDKLQAICNESISVVGNFMTAVDSCSVVGQIHLMVE